jgi:hypothetical protein
MGTQFDKTFAAGMQEHAVVSACFDLGWSMQDKDIRKELENPKSIRDLEKAYAQLGYVIRKLKFGVEVAPVISGECREVQRESV